MWILERQGSEFDDEREFNTLDEAYEVMEAEYEETLENYNDTTDIDETYAYVGNCEFYQSWNIYEKKDNLTELEEMFEEIDLQIGRIYRGVDQYSWELQDTGVITGYVNMLEEMIEELKGLIK